MMHQLKYLQGIRTYNESREEEIEVEENACEDEVDLSEEAMESEIREILLEAENLEKEMDQMSAVRYEGMTRLPCAAHKVKLTSR